MSRKEKQNKPTLIKQLFIIVNKCKIFIWKFELQRRLKWLIQMGWLEKVNDF